MAKWGEGDPRWIVEERPDATNVNNWHWTEKNACQWSHCKIKSLFEGLEIEFKTSKVKIKKVDKCEGEASANNRKAKLIFFYEWNITLDWVARIAGVEEEVQGTINIPNLSEENDVDEIEVNITLQKSTPEGLMLKEELFNKGRKIIREKLADYICSLKEEFSKGMILPRKENNGSTDSKSISRTPSESKKAPLLSPYTPTDDKIDSQYRTSTLDFNLQFECSAEDFYNALTLSQHVAHFTSGPVKIDAKEGGKFELFGGNIYGEFVELVPHTKIIQKWRLKSWKEGHYSTVTFNINQKADHTQVIMQQKGVPETEKESTSANWGRYYWEAMKRALGFGFFL